MPSAQAIGSCEAGTRSASGVGLGGWWGRRLCLPRLASLPEKVVSALMLSRPQGGCRPCTEKGKRAPQAGLPGSVWRWGRGACTHQRGGHPMTPQPAARVAGQPHCTWDSRQVRGRLLVLWTRAGASPPRHRGVR